MKVRVETLRAAITTLLDQVQELRGDEVEIPDELYWWVSRDAVHDPTTTPTALTLGALADDAAEIVAIGRGEQAPIPYALVWAATVLRSLGEQGTAPPASPPSALARRWSTLFCNDPRRGYELYLELTIDDEAWGGIHRRVDGELVLRAFADHGTLVPLAWLTSILPLAATLPLPDPDADDPPSV